MKRLVISKEIGSNKFGDKSITQQKRNPLQNPIYGAEGPMVITFNNNILSAIIHSNGGRKASTWERVLDLSFGDVIDLE